MQYVYIHSFIYFAPTNNILVTYGALQVLYCIVLYCIVLLRDIDTVSSTKLRT